MKKVHLQEFSDITNIIKEQQLTSVIIETGNENVFNPQENKFIITKDFLLDAELVFENCASLKKVDLENLDFSEITTMTEWFWGCTNLTEIVFPQMAQCKNVTSLYGCFGETNINVIDLSFMNFDENLDEITFTKTFYNSNAKKIILPKCKVEDLCDCFEKCYNLEEVIAPIIIDDFDEYTLLETFSGCKKLKLINVENAVFDKQEFMDELNNELNSNEFAKNCVILLPVKIKLKSKTLLRADEIRQMIKKNQLQDIIIETGDKNVFIPHNNKFIVTKEFLSNEEDVFSNCTTLKRIDMSNFDFTKIKSMKAWFYACRNLQKIVFPEESDFETLTDLSYCFAYTNIDIIDLSFMWFDVDSQPLSLTSSFSSARAKKITLPKCNVEYMENCFSWCFNLEEIIAPINLDLITNENVLNGTFCLCPNLKMLNFSDGRSSTIEFIKQLTNPDHKNIIPPNCSIKLP